MMEENKHLEIKAVRDNSDYVLGSIIISTTEPGKYCFSLCGGDRVWLLEHEIRELQDLFTAALKAGTE